MCSYIGSQTANPKTLFFASKEWTPNIKPNMDWLCQLYKITIACIWHIALKCNIKFLNQISCSYIQKRVPLCFCEKELFFKVLPFFYLKIDGYYIVTAETCTFLILHWYNQNAFQSHEVLQINIYKMYTKMSLPKQ